MIKNIDYEGIVFAFLALAIIYLTVNIIGDNEKETIRKNLCVVTSTIKKVGGAGYRNSYSKLYVEFLWKNEVIKADFSSPNPKCNVVSSQLLLAVDSTNIERAVLLLKPEDFEEFNLALPDSLKWTIACFKL